MNDLFSVSFSEQKGRNYVDLKRDTLRDLEMGEMAGAESQNLSGFFEEVGMIKDEMENLRGLFSKLQEANEESKMIHRAQQMKDLRKRMDEDIEEILKKAKLIKARLENLDKANIANRRYKGCEEGTPTDRTRISITNSLRKKLKDLMGDFQLLRQRIMGEYKETIERRYYAVTGQNAEEQTIEQMIATGESENFLQKAIQEQGRGQIIETIREMQERHDAVKELEKNLLELHQIFLDMAVLVEAQGEQLNDIEHHISHAASYVDRGTQQLQAAKRRQRNTRKWMFFGVILLLIIILVIVVPIVTTLKK